MSLWWTIFAAGVITYLTRVSLIAAGDRITLPEPVERALRHVGSASFAAIAVPAVFGDDRLAGFGDDAPALIAVVVAGLVVHRTRSVPASLAAGMATLWLVLALS